MESLSGCGLFDMTDQVLLVLEQFLNKSCLCIDDRRELATRLVWKDALSRCQSQWVGRCVLSLVEWEHAFAWWENNPVIFN